MGDAIEQIRAAMALLGTVQPRRERAQERFDAAIAELDALKRQEAALREIVDHYTRIAEQSGLSVPRAEAEVTGLRGNVEEAMRRLGRPAGVKTIQDEVARDLPGVSYYSVRTVLDRGMKRGRYIRCQRDYALAADRSLEEPPFDIPESSATPHYTELAQ